VEPAVIARAALAASIALFVALPAAALGGPPEVFTFTGDGSQVVQLTDHPPCTGTATITYHDTFHVTDFGDGNVRVADAQAGTVVYVSTDGRTFTGRYAGTFVHQSPPIGAQFTEGGTFRLVATAPDGTRLRFAVHTWVTSTPDGRFATVIDTARCSV
jgi:hypothetical protein